jgi:hypothetical protein
MVMEDHLIIQPGMILLIHKKTIHTIKFHQLEYLVLDVDVTNPQTVNYAEPTIVTLRDVSLSWIVD